ncbi:MAG: hypothetical protein JXQ29_06350 [Planctomycetes bacterium]|nr:hypothetical protein [Planctomycetota bacterium]
MLQRIVLLWVGAILALLLGRVHGQPADGLDRVVLRNGSVVRGRIVSATEDAVVLAFRFGGQVEFRRSDVQSLDRAEPSEAPAPRAGEEPALRLEDRFLIYHGDELVGFRRLVERRCRRLGQPGMLLEEEVVFRDPPSPGEDPGEACRVVTLEFRSEGGDLRTLYYREVGMGTDSIVDAVWRADRLEYTWLRGGQRSRHEVSLAADVRFPLGFWKEAARVAVPAAGTEWRAEVWDPRALGSVQVAVRRFEDLAVAVGAVRRPVGVLQVDGPRGRLFRWLSPEGRTLKEQLNGVSLQAVVTSRPALPARAVGAPLPDGPERALLNLRIDVDSGLVLQTPRSGWTDSPEGRPGAAFTLVNRELRSWLAVYWTQTGAVWPESALPPGARVEPANFGGWPGEGWRGPAVGCAGRELVVRRLETPAGSVVAALEMPVDLAPAVLLDYAAILRSMQVPGRAR